MQIVNSVAVVFAIILFGAVLRRLNFFSAEFTAGMSKVTYWIGLPALLFFKTATAHPDLAATGRTFLVMIIGTAAAIVIGYIAAWAMRLKAASTGAFVQGAFRGNVAFIGLPVILFAAAGREDSGEWGQMAALVIAPIIPVFVLLSLAVLLAGRQKMDAAGLKKFAVQFALNPMFLACLAGGLYSFTGRALWPPVERAVGALGTMSEPMALLAIGATLAAVGIKGRWAPALASSLIKVVAVPLVGLLAARLMGLNQMETAVALIYLACPSAVASFIMAEQLDADDELAATSVVISTLLGMVALAVVVGMV
jgi:malate permease and related proteins